MLRDGWNIADCAARSYDIEGMHVGTVAAGRIGLAVLKRLKPFDVHLHLHLHYTDRHRLPEDLERELGMTPHISGTSRSAQARYAARVREILECFLEGRPIREEYLIVEGGRLAGAGAHSYSEGDTTEGAEEAARFHAAPGADEEPAIIVEPLRD